VTAAFSCVVFIGSGQGLVLNFDCLRNAIFGRNRYIYLSDGPLCRTHGGTSVRSEPIINVMQMLPPTHTHHAKANSGPRATDVRLPCLLLVGLIIPCVITYALTKANELQVIAVVVGILGVVAILVRPFWGLILFTGLLYVRPEDSIPALAGMHFTLIVSLVTLAGAFLLFNLQHIPLVNTPVNGLVLGFVLMAMVSNIESISTTVQDIGKLGLLVLLVLNLVRSPQSFRSLLTTVLVCSSYLAAFSIYLYFAGAAYDEHGLQRSQATGIFNNPNDLADTIGAGLALSLGRMLTESGWRRLFYLVTTPVMIWAILITHSRGGLVAMGVVCIGTLLYYVRNKIVATLILATLAGMMMFSGGSDRNTNFDMKEESAHSRIVFWDNALSHLAASPITGVGYGGFASLNHGFQAHNSFVTCFVEIGLPGYFCWMGVLYYAFRRKPRDPRLAKVSAPEERTRQEAALVRAVRSDEHFAKLALVGYLVGSFTSNHAFSPVLYMLMSLAIVSTSVSDGTFAPPELTPGERKADLKRIALLCLGSIALIFAIVHKVGT